MMPVIDCSLNSAPVDDSNRKENVAVAVGLLGIILRAFLPRRRKKVSDKNSEPEKGRLYITIQRK